MDALGKKLTDGYWKASTNRDALHVLMIVGRFSSAMQTP
jgi:hypothetical protein